MKYRLWGFVALIGLITNSQAANIVNEANVKAVNQVKWHNQADGNSQELLNQPIPQNSANVIFLYPIDKTHLQIGVNIAINDRFQVSLYPNHFSQIYSCKGANKISGAVADHKNNDLLKNAISFKLEPNTTYFFAVDVNNQAQTTIKQLTQDNALVAIKNMKHQTHQISRVVPNCPVSPKFVVATPMTLAPKT